MKIRKLAQGLHAQPLFKHASSKYGYNKRYKIERCQKPGKCAQNMKRKSLWELHVALAQDQVQE